MIAELLPFVNTFFRFPSRRLGKRAEMRFHSRRKRPARRIQGPQPPNEKRPARRTQSAPACFRRGRRCHLWRQVLRVNRARMGKISSRPASMSKISTSLDKVE